MELIKIINARNVLDSFADRAEIGAHLAYWMTKFVVKTVNEQTFYHNEMNKLFEKYAEKNEDDTIRIPNERISEFNQAMEELGQTNVEDPGIRFNLSELATELRLSMQQMYPLLDFIDEDK